MQYHTVTYLGCHLDYDLSGEPTAMKLFLKNSMQGLNFFIHKTNIQHQGGP